MYIGSGTSRNTVTAIVLVCSILCVGFMMFSNAFLGFYLGIFNTRFIEKNCANESVAQKIGLTDSDMHIVIDTLVTSVKKGTEPNATVTLNGNSTQFFSDSDKEGIANVSHTMILLRRLSYAFIGISLALFMMVLMEGRAVILRNTLAVTWGIILIAGGTMYVYMQVNPEKFRDGFFEAVLTSGKPLSGWLAQIMNHAMLRSAFLMEICLFLIVQLLFLIIVNGFTGTKKKKR